MSKLTAKERDDATELDQLQFVIELNVISYTYFQVIVIENFWC